MSLRSSYTIYYYLTYPKGPMHCYHALLLLIIIPLSEITSLLLHSPWLAG